MKKYLLAVLLLAPLANGDTVPATMRVDYFHTGNAETEIFSLDRVVVEPLPWSGNMAQPIDKTLRGKYLFEIVAGGEIVWSRSFSSIYGEWETTGEARSINRSFHESVRFPAQDDVFELVVKKRGAGNAFEEAWRIELDPADVLVHHTAAVAKRDISLLECGQFTWPKVTCQVLAEQREQRGDRFPVARELLGVATL